MVSHVHFGGCGVMTWLEGMRERSEAHQRLKLISVGT